MGAPGGTPWRCTRQRLARPCPGRPLASAQPQALPPVGLGRCPRRVALALRSGGLSLCFCQGVGGCWAAACGACPWRSAWPPWAPFASWQTTGTFPAPGARAWWRTWRLPWRQCLQAWSPDLGGSQSASLWWGRVPARTWPPACCSGAQQQQLLLLQLLLLLQQLRRQALRRRQWGPRSFVTRCCLQQQQAQRPCSLPFATQRCRPRPHACAALLAWLACTTCRRCGRGCRPCAAALCCRWRWGQRRGSRQ